MKVAFDTRPLSDAHGIGRYARCLLRALRTTAEATDEVIEVGRPTTMLRSRSADVFHAPWMSGAMLRSPCPMVVTVHDLSALKRRSEHLRGGVRLRLRHLAVQRAPGVVVPSATVARDVVESLEIERERIAVIPHAPDRAMRPRSEAEVAAVRSRLELPERYLVSVGSLEHPDPGKHVAELAAAERELPLVMVGQTRPWAHELPGVILTGHVSDEQLAAIYTGAHALVLSSDSEGFGLSAVEALACGTPVASFRVPALVEVLGERIAYAELGDMCGLMTAAQSLSRPAPAPPRWSWDDAASATWSAYRRAAEAAAQTAVARPLRRRPRSAGGLEAR